MELNSNNLVNLDVSSLKKFDKIDTKNLKETELKKVCDDFESFFLNQILEVSLKDTNIAGEGAGSDVIKGMYTTTVADSSSGRLGISSMLYEFLTQNNK